MCVCLIHIQSSFFPSSILSSPSSPSSSSIRPICLSVPAVPVSAVPRFLALHHSSIPTPSISLSLSFTLHQCRQPPFIPSLLLSLVSLSLFLSFILPPFSPSFSLPLASCLSGSHHPPTLRPGTKHECSPVCSRTTLTPQAFSSSSQRILLTQRDRKKRDKVEIAN